MYTGLGRAPALHYAVENGQVETAKLLRKAGMDTGIENEVHEDCRKAFDYVLMSQHNPIAPSRMRSGKSSTQTPAFGATSCWPTCGQHGDSKAVDALRARTSSTDTGCYAGMLSLDFLVVCSCRSPTVIHYDSGASPFPFSISVLMQQMCVNSVLIQHKKSIRDGWRAQSSVKIILIELHAAFAFLTSRDVVHWRRRQSPWLRGVLVSLLQLLDQRRQQAARAW